MKKSIVGLMLVAMVMVGCSNQQSTNTSTTTKAAETTVAAETSVQEGESAQPVEEEVEPEEVEVTPQVIENPTLSEQAKAAIDESIRAEMETAEVEETSETEDGYAAFMEEQAEQQRAYEERANSSQRVVVNGVEIVADEHVDEVLDGMSFIYKGETNGNIQFYSIDGYADLRLVTIHEGGSHKVVVEYALDAYDTPVPEYKDIVDPATGWYFGQEVTRETIEQAELDPVAFEGTGDREPVLGYTNDHVFTVMYGKLGAIGVGARE